MTSPLSSRPLLSLAFPRIFRFVFLVLGDGVWLVEQLLFLQGLLRGCLLKAFSFCCGCCILVTKKGVFRMKIFVFRKKSTIWVYVLVDAGVKSGFFVTYTHVTNTHFEVTGDCPGSNVSLEQSKNIWNFLATLSWEETRLCSCGNALRYIQML